jgi:threonine dehydrogenase-like Zn-dependent dehydrogenase
MLPSGTLAKSSTPPRTALVEPLAVAWHAVKNSPIQKGDDTLVIGAGPVGLAVIQVLKAWGARTIVVSELSTRRKQLASEFGATHLLDPRAPDVVARCREICGGEGPAIVLDVAGVQSGLDLALTASRPGATIVNIATWREQPRINSIALLTGEKRYVGTMVHVKEDFAQVIQAIGSGASIPCVQRVCLFFVCRCPWESSK